MEIIFRGNVLLEMLFIALLRICIMLKLLFSYLPLFVTSPYL